MPTVIDLSHVIEDGTITYPGLPRPVISDHLGRATETAERLAGEGAAVVGIDSVNIDGTRTGERPVHTVLLGAGVPVVDHLRGLDRVGGRPFRFFAVPPVAGMGTFPVWALAVLGL